MRLTTIQAAALKGQTFTHAIGAATLFAGRNDVGKTARADAIRLVLLGYLPELGKTNAATFALASGSKMSVGADIEGHGPIKREWTARGKTVKATETGTEELPETPLVLLSAQEYFAKSDAARVQMLWQCLNVDPAKWTTESVLQKVREACGPAYELLPTGAIVTPERGETLQAWMERLAERLREEASTSAAEVRRWEQTAQGITAAALQETPVDAARVETDLATAQRQLEELVGKQGQLQAVVRQQDTASERQQQVQARIADLLAKIGERPLSERPADEMEAEVGKLEAERATAMEKWRGLEAAAENSRRQLARLEELRTKAESFAARAAALSAAEAAVARIEAELEQLPEDLAERAQEALGAANRAKADAEARQRANDESVQRMEAEALELMRKPCCPICGTKGEQFHEILEKRFAKMRNELQGQAVAIGKDFTQATDALAAAQKAQNTAIAQQRQRQALERQFGDARLAVSQAKAARDNHESIMEEIAHMGTPEPVVVPPATELHAIAAQIADLRDEAARLRLNEKLAAAQEELRAISIDGEEDAEQRLGETEDRIEALRARIAELETARQQAANQVADQKRLAQAAEEKAKAGRAGEAIGKARDAVGEERAALIKETFGPLLAVANTFTAGILDTPLEYREGELGRYRGGSWVPVRTFGGTHQAVTYAGIQAALGASAPAKIVLVDELGRFDADNKRKFVGNVLAALRDGLIEQFVGIDVDPVPYKFIDGLTVEIVG